MAEWFSIEVSDGSSPAGPWMDAYGDLLAGLAVSHGALDWDRHRFPWGGVLEFEFSDDEAWEAFRSHPTVTAALDAVPDPVGGLLVYRGRGGSSGARWPRRPRPRIGSGAAALPVPVEAETVEPVAAVRVLPVGAADLDLARLPASA